MRLEKTLEYKRIKISPEQEKNISSLDKIHAALQQPGNEGFNLFLAKQKIGFILIRQFSPGCFFLWDLIIDLNFQNQGHGKTALLCLIDYLKETYDGKILTTTYISGNEHAKALYSKIGFQETDTVTVNGIDEVNLKKVL